MYSGGGQHVCAGGSCADTEKVVIIFDFFPAVALNSIFVKKVIAGSDFDFAFDFLAAGIVIVVAAFDGLPGTRRGTGSLSLTGMGLLIGDSGRRFRSLGNRCPGSCLGGKSTCQERTGQAKACCKSFEIFLFPRFLLFGSFTIIIYYMRSEL